MSFPNPGMLPLSEAGGALSGANFGVFYTVMMQVGYKHYAPQVIEDLNRGMPLFEALQRVQSELRPFNDKIIQEAVDRLPTMFEITVDMLEKFIEGRASQGAQNIKEGAFVPDFLKNLIPSFPEAEAYRGSRQTTAAPVYSTSSSKTTGTGRSKATPIYYQGRYMSLVEWNQIKSKERVASLTQSRQFSTARIQSTPAAGGRAITQRAAGQSQKIERVRLLQVIAKQANLIKTIHLAIARNPLGSRARNSAQKQLTVAHTYLVARQQELTNLLNRYRF